MTMYLPNHDVRPTGAELAEFIDVSPRADDVSAARSVDASRTPETTEDDQLPRGANAAHGA